MLEEQILPDALRDVDLGSEVIEIGPGPGLTTDVLRKQTDNLVAVELDPDLAALLETRFRGTNVEVIRGDATALDLPDDRFSAGASFHMLHHVGSVMTQNRVFAELARVVRTGGPLIAADGVFSEGSLAFHQDDTYNPVDPDGLGDRLEQAGFRSVNIAMHSLGWYCSAIVA